MRAQRIKTGFHRLGIAVAVAAMLPVVFTVGHVIAAGHTSQDAVNFAWCALSVAVLAYPVARALAWIIAGFAGDEISN